MHPTALLNRAFVLTALIACALLLTAQTIHYARKPNVAEGKKLWNAGCNACHGADGRGASEALTVFKRPETFPDFTRCDQTTAEANMAWKATIVYGGAARGFSPIMPAFGELLTNDQIDDLVAYMRTLCTNPHWARGELNLPRALVTEKAYPEDEVVVSTAVNASGAPGFTTDIIHEQRFGVHNQIEVDVPINAQDQNHTWYGGVGDTTLAVKREMWSSLRTGSILSLQAGALVPTGSKTRGFGSGTTTLETFAAFDQLFKSNTWVQFQIGADLPHDTKIAPQATFYRTAIGQTFAGKQRLGRLWSPMVEVLADRDLVDGAKTNWDVLPEMQVTLSRRQHVRFDVGVRNPATNTQGRQRSVLFYLLWDWADGKLTEGW